MIWVCSHQQSVCVIAISVLFAIWNTNLPPLVISEHILSPSFKIQAFPSIVGVPPGFAFPFEWPAFPRVCVFPSLDLGLPCYWLAVGRDESLIRGVWRTFLFQSWNCVFEYWICRLDSASRMYVSFFLDTASTQPRNCAEEVGKSSEC